MLGFDTPAPYTDKINGDVTNRIIPRSQRFSLVYNLFSRGESIRFWGVNRLPRSPRVSTLL